MRRLAFALLCTAACTSTPSNGFSETPDDGEFAQDAGPAPMAQTSPDQSVEPDRPTDTIFRSELQRATHGGRPGYLLKQLGPEPYRPTGRFQGWQITRVFPDDPDLCRAGCDLAIGDVIVTVNGRFIERPEHLSELMESLNEMSSLRVKLIRDGALVERDWAIAEG